MLVFIEPNKMDQAYCAKILANYLTLFLFVVWLAGEDAN